MYCLLNFYSNVKNSHFFRWVFLSFFLSSNNEFLTTALQKILFFFLFSFSFCFLFLSLQYSCTVCYLLILFIVAPPSQENSECMMSDVLGIQIWTYCCCWIWKKSLNENVFIYWSRNNNNKKLNKWMNLFPWHLFSLKKTLQINCWNVFFFFFFILKWWQIEMKLLS